MRNLETLLAFTEQSVYNVTGHYLSDLQRVILREFAQDPKKTYEQVGLEYKYSGNYIQRIAAPRLWQLLSKVTGQKVTKSNLRSVLERQLAAKTDNLSASIYSPLLDFNSSNNTINSSAIKSPLIDYPTGSVPLDSPFYVQRSQQELLCYQAILQPSSLIQISGPRQIGKTSLLLRVLDYVKSENIQTITLNFKQVDKSILSDVNKLLRWLCACITQKLKLKPHLESYWNDDMGSKMSCTIYMEDYLLRNIKSPMVLALDEVGELFEYPTIAQEFFELLRTWYEQSKVDKTWHFLRLILVKSTEPYINSSLHQSHFRLGLEVTLPSFTIEQVKDLSDHHGLEISSQQLQQLMQFVHGHPYLIRWMLFHLVKSQCQFKDVIAAAATDAGIYQEHLHRHLESLNHYPELKPALQQVLNSADPVQLEMDLALRLHSVGLVKWVGNQVAIACELYQQYFSQHC